MAKPPGYPPPPGPPSIKLMHGSNFLVLAQPPRHWHSSVPPVVQQSLVPVAFSHRLMQASRIALRTSGGVRVVTMDDLHDGASYVIDVEGDPVDSGGSGDHHDHGAAQTQEQ
jgi:hypothetical protein